MRVVYWGTYDTGKPRNRIMIRGLRENGVEVIECHAEVWEGIDDKSQIHNWSQKLHVFAVWLLSYPGLIWRYLRLPKHDAVIVGYMGHLDILVLWLFAKLRRVPVIWDVFLSLYNTAVEDRNLVAPNHLLAPFLFAWEWTACRAADCIILDTKTHGQYFVDKFRLPHEKVDRVFLGAETDVFMPESSNQIETTANKRSGSFTALFYGQYIPLQGIETVVRAAKLTDSDNIRWVLIGKGQESPKILDLIEELKPTNLEQIDWVPYEELITRIHNADVCLGIFGGTDKAKRVIPNKVFQILAAGSPLITGDTPAIRELVNNDNDVILVPVADSQALSSTVLLRFSARQNAFLPIDLHSAIRKRISPRAVGFAFKVILETSLSKAKMYNLD